MAAKNFWRKWFGRGIDRLAWHSMHLIARRQEKKVAPSYPADLRQPLADPAALFAASTGQAACDVQYTPWEKRRDHWRRDLSFATALPSRIAENDRVFVRSFAARPEASHPAVIMLHGLMNVSMIAYRPFIQAVLDYGATAHALELPFHHRRTPRGSFSGDLFHTANLARTMHAVQQAVSDTGQLLATLRQAGAPQVGVLGFSLGAWLGALVACTEPELDFAFLGMLPCHLNQLVWHSALGAQLRRRFVEQGWDEKLTAPLYDRLDPVNFQPQLAPGRIHLYGAQFDTLLAPAKLRALQRAWGMPPLRLYPHGHLTIMIARQLHRDFRENLQQQLACAPTQQPA